jgi:hypothetical protein
MNVKGYFNKASLNCLCLALLILIYASFASVCSLLNIIIQLINYNQKSLKTWDPGDNYSMCFVITLVNATLFLYFQKKTATGICVVHSTKHGQLIWVFFNVNKSFDSYNFWIIKFDFKPTIFISFEPLTRTLTEGGKVGLLSI